MKCGTSLVASFILLVGLGCSGDDDVLPDGGLPPADGPVASPDAPSTPDAGADSDVPPDASTPPDAPPCTDDAMCDDGLRCTGTETCDRVLGCQPGVPEACDDAVLCTTDLCNESGELCTHSTVDDDADGDPVRTCGGGDCDDSNALVSSFDEESATSGTCGDGLDNDCDDQADLRDAACLVDDTCATATTISGAGMHVIPGDTTSAVHNQDPTCGFPWNSVSSSDVFYSLELTSNASVEIAIEGAAGAGGAQGLVLALLTDCTGYDQLDCDATPTGMDRRVDVRWGNLEAGTYILRLHTGTRGAFTLSVDIGAPDPRPSNDLCSGAQTITTLAGGSVERVTAPLYQTDNSDARSDASIGCGAFGDPADLFYRLVLTEQSDVRIDGVTVTSPAPCDASGAACGPDADSCCSGMCGSPSSGALVCQSQGRAWIGLRDACGDASQIACSTTMSSTGSEPMSIAERLDPGTYYIVVAADPAGDMIGGKIVDFTVSVAPVPGDPTDTCPGARLCFNTPYSGDMAFAADDYEDCATTGTAERMHQFTLWETRTVAIQGTSTMGTVGTDIGWSILNACGPMTAPAATAATLACLTSPGEIVLTAGAYWLEMVSFAPADYTITLDSWRSVFVDTSSSPGDGCNPSTETLPVITTDAGFLHTVGIANDHDPSCAAGTGGQDAFYELHLTSSSLVEAHVFDIDYPASRSYPIDWIVGIQSGCGTSRVERACGTDRVEAILPAGDYILFVDQPAAAGGARYELNVNVTSPPSSRPMCP